MNPGCHKQIMAVPLCSLQPSLIVVNLFKRCENIELLLRLVVGVNLPRKLFLFVKNIELTNTVKPLILFNKKGKSEIFFHLFEEASYFLEIVTSQS
jgi:hypothetical protein